MSLSAQDSLMPLNNPHILIRYACTLNSLLLHHFILRESGGWSSQRSQETQPDLSHQISSSASHHRLRPSCSQGPKNTCNNMMFKKRIAVKLKDDSQELLKPSLFNEEPNSSEASKTLHDNTGIICWKHNTNTRYWIQEIIIGWYHIWDWRDHTES